MFLVHAFRLHLTLRAYTRQTMLPDDSIHLARDGEQAERI